MSQKKYITKERKFKHLDMYQRGKIEVMLKMKIHKAQIARELGSPARRYTGKSSVEQCSN